MTIKIPSIASVVALSFVDIDMTKDFDFRFDNTSPNWTNRQDHNQFFVSMCQRLFNDKLRARGYVFLNEVLEYLAIQPIPSGQILGWGRDDILDIQIQQAYTHGIISTGFILHIEPAGVILDEIGKN